MGMRFRQLGLSVLAVVLAGCSGGGGGGGGALQLFFGSEGTGEYKKIVVSVNLKAANAAVSIRDGKPHCDLDASRSGCTITPVLQGGSDTLTVTIEGCTIPGGEVNLFSCQFEEGANSSKLSSATSTQGECKVAGGCDPSPSQCVGEDPGPCGADTTTTTEYGVTTTTEYGVTTTTEYGATTTTEYGATTTTEYGVTTTTEYGVTTTTEYGATTTTEYGVTTTTEQPALVRLFFGVNGNGSCDGVVTAVDLAAANATVARDNEGSPQCILDAALAAAGCQLQLELGDGTLVATVDNCTVPPVTDLFSCLFETVDLSDIGSVTATQCQCHLAGCDINPPTCVSQDSSPTSCEDCNNGLDDDGNGLVDCEDPNCRYSLDCHGETTTTTSSSSTSITSTSTTTSTSTSTSITTSTTIVEGLACSLVFRLDDDSSVGALQWDVGYDSAPGQFAGSGGDVECSALPGAGSANLSANDKESQRVLTIGIVGIEGFFGPADIAECRFKATVAPTAADFDITVVDAADPDGIPIFPMPPVILGSINCEGSTTTTEGPTTTLGATTTTEEVVTTTIGPTTTTTAQPGGKYAVTFSQTNAATYGALQLKVGYVNAPGGFTGTGATVVCTKISAAGNAAYNDNEGSKLLGLGWIALDGSTGPQTLTVCDFDATEALVAGDFTVAIEDAVDPDFNPISVTIGVSVAPK